MPDAILPAWLRVRPRSRSGTAPNAAAGVDTDAGTAVDADAPPVMDGHSGNGHRDTADGHRDTGENAEPADTPEPADAEVPPAEPDDDRRVRRPEWRLLAILMTVGFVVFAVAIRLRMLHGNPAGDEPAYLVISQTLQKYHSVDVMLDHNHGDYRSFYPGPLEPHVVTAENGRMEPLHNIGGPLLWLIPFMLFGRLGALGFIAVVSLLIVGNVYYFLRERGIEPMYAFLVSLLLIIASPIYTYASMAFVEPIGALIILYAMRVLLAPRLGTVRLTVAAIGLAALPWIHSRFLMFTAIIGALFVFRIYRQSGWSVRPYLPLVLPIVISLIGTEVYNLALWGTLNPASNMSNAGNGPFQVSPAVGLIGTLFDRQVGLITNYPIFVLVLPGVLLSLNRARLWMHGALMAVTLPYLLLICTFSAWWAGYSPPARYIMVVLPLLAYYVAYALQRINSILVVCATVALSLATYALSLASDIFPNDRFAAPGNHNYAMDRLGQLFGARFVKYVPSAFEAGQHPLFLTWLAVATTVGLLLWVWGVFRPQLPGGDWVPAPRQRTGMLRTSQSQTSSTS
jgi:hypothetical protein